LRVLVRMSPTLIDGLDGAIPFGGDVLTDAGARQIYGFLTAPERLGRIFMVSGKVPAARKAVLRAAFDTMVKNEAFLADAKKVRLEGAADGRRRGRSPHRRACTRRRPS